MLAGAVIAWRSKKQTTIALSSTEVEYIAIALAAKVVWIKSILEELNLFNIPAITLFCDNQSCIKLANNIKMSDNI
jgi:hypothetical protein